MRVLVDIGNEQIQALDALSKVVKRSRAPLIRDAVVEYLARCPSSRSVDAFGL